VEQLSQRELELRAAERSAEAIRDELRSRQEGLLRQRNHLEGWQARLTAQDVDWKAEREALMAQLQSRERILQARAEQLEAMQQQWSLRTSEESEALRQARERCDEARKQYSAVWQECEALRESLNQQERNLSSRALAVERYRQEMINQSPDSAKAESRLDRLFRREAARLEVDARDLEAERQKLRQERIRLDEQEKQQAIREEEDQLHQQELRRLRAQHALDQRQVRQLREEIERIACLLIEEAVEEPPLQQHAA
jgi:hypothetical protein